MPAAAQTHAFQAEVNEVLSIVVNSLYSHREVFLRELISNASDALDRRAFAALTQHQLLAGHEPSIDIIPAKDAGTLTIRDNGIGMTRAELIDNLGTIARSGSKRLVQSLAQERRQDLALIGQFGVGFYSAFLVADRVTVTSKAAGSDEPASQWQSEAKGEFTVGDADREQAGTDVILHLKEDAREFLDEWTLRDLVRKYSDYVRHPIRLQVERTVDKGAAPVREWETVNTARALWMRPKAEIAPEQYVEFYKHLAHDWQEPLAHAHFKVEGTHELIGLLFIPGQRPLDLFERRGKGLRLFVRRVFIMEDCEALLPEYLRFVRGVVDSEDLPLNVSREVLQRDATTRFIRKQVTQRVLALLEELAAEGETTAGSETTGKREATAGDAASGKGKVDRYAVFWAIFGAVLKEGVHLEPEHKERIAALLRYDSSKVDRPTSLRDYVARMAPDQPGIYYLTAASAAAARGSPHIERLRQRGYEVLFMTDPIDEWVVEALREHGGVKLIDAAKGALALPPDDEAAKQRRDEAASELGALVGSLKELFGERVKDVRLTDRLVDSPACLVTEEHGLSPRLERILRASGQAVPEQRRILELNPAHAVVRALREMAGDPARRGELEKWSRLLFEQALVAEGNLPDDPAALAQAITELLRLAVAPRD